MAITLSILNAFSKYFTSITLYALSNGAIVNDLERPQTQISRSRHYLTLSISEIGDTNMFYDEIQISNNLE